MNGESYKESLLADMIKDTSPLSPGDLSEHEVRTVFDIEHHLREVQASNAERDTRRVRGYFAEVEDRYPRVLLLDGSRGTGKTSLLLTLARRWNSTSEDHRKNFDAAFKERVDALADPAYVASNADRPSFVRVLRILDFDPLPPEMPLAAGLIQAWRPLIAEYERIALRLADYGDSEEESLTDRWLRLFRVAAIGWTPIPRGTGLVEQVLDREEQIGDWQALSEQWRDFVEHVLLFGENHRHECKVPQNPVFVVMIDDVDLQVERVSELLPALRMLYHPAVVFIVAGDHAHLVDMLKLDFFGRQAKIATYRGGGASVLSAAEDDPWCSELAEASFQKVFAARFRYRLRALTFSEFLEFPRGPRTFRVILNGLGPPTQLDEPFPPLHSDLALGDYLAHYANLIEKLSPELPTATTYRTAQQLADQALSIPDGGRAARIVLRRILYPRAVVRLEEALEQPIDETTIEYRPVGELAAAFAPQLVENIIPRRQQIVLSAKPAFVFRADDDGGAKGSRASGALNVSVLPMLVAVSLRDAHRNVDAPGLRWEARLSFARTRWIIQDYEASFRWHLHVLPIPLQMFEWTKTWGEFIRSLSSETTTLRDRIAYGWIYHQLLWLKKEAPEAAKPSEAQLEGPVADETWNRLLANSPPADTDLKLGKNRWLRRTLPLLARPEIGFTPEVQSRLLSKTKEYASVGELVAERRRLVRDAFDAAAVGQGKRLAEGMEEEDLRVDEVLRVIDTAYPKAPFHAFIAGAENLNLFEGR